MSLYIILHINGKIEDLPQQIVVHFDGKVRSGKVSLAVQLEHTMQICIHF